MLISLLPGEHTTTAAQSRSVESPGPRAPLIKSHKFCGLLSVYIIQRIHALHLCEATVKVCSLQIFQGMFRNECPILLIMGLHKKHNEEDVRLKARPVGRCPKARLCVIAFYHATSMI